jgi:DNA repair exonuclease SbcCD ATPase subunit
MFNLKKIKEKIKDLEERIDSLEYQANLNDEAISLLASKMGVTIVEGNMGVEIVECDCCGNKHKNNKKK